LTSKTQHGKYNKLYNFNKFEAKSFVRRLKHRGKGDKEKYQNPAIHQVKKKIISSSGAVLRYI
jgi:hypothetical protein